MALTGEGNDVKTTIYQKRHCMQTNPQTLATFLETHITAALRRQSVQQNHIKMGFTSNSMQQQTCMAI